MKSSIKRAKECDEAGVYRIDVRTRTCKTATVYAGLFLALRVRDREYKKNGSSSLQKEKPTLH